MSTHHYGITTRPNRKHRRLRMLWRRHQHKVTYVLVMGAMLAFAIVIYSL